MICPKLKRNQKDLFPERKNNTDCRYHLCGAIEIIYISIAWIWAIAILFCAKTQRAEFLRRYPARRRIMRSTGWKRWLGTKIQKMEERRSMYDRVKRKEIFPSFSEKEAGKRLDTLPFGSYNKSEAVPQEKKEEAVSARGCIKYRKARLQWGDGYELPAHYKRKHWSGAHLLRHVQ